jgi:hypothetical protein
VLKRFPITRYLQRSVLFRYVIDDDINTATAAELKIVLFGLFGNPGGESGTEGDTRWPPDTRGLPPGEV